MIVSKSQSQVTVPEESRGQFTSCKVGDSVLYHSLLRLASPQQVWGHCPRWVRFAQAGCRHELRPMTFLDPGPFAVTYSLSSTQIKVNECIGQ